MRMVQKSKLVEDLLGLGLRSGDCVMLHSSLSSLGPIEGGAETVVDALLEAVGPDGTILAPAFRSSVWGHYSDFTIDNCPCEQKLCSSNQRGFQGVIAEVIRKLPGSLRSCHPTHSWVGVGPMAARLLSGHRESPTPCGKGNPFEELVNLDGCILTLGVQVNTITLWHYYEEILSVPYMGHYWSELRFLNHCVPGRRIQYEFPGIIQDVCRAAGILKTHKVGKGDSGLMRAKEFDSFMATIIADDPFCMVVRPPDRNCLNLSVDALQKAQAMLRAWEKGPVKPVNKFKDFPAPVEIPDSNTKVREDCPAFAGFHKANNKKVPLCRANDRHPSLFKLGGIFDKCGPAICKICSWHEKFPPKK